MDHPDRRSFQGGSAQPELTVHLEATFQPELNFRSERTSASSCVTPRRQVLGGLAAVALGAVGLAQPRRALAQSDKAVRFILPVATGSGVDTITRAASG